MPSERFYNLKPEKQERICAAALQEFVAYRDNYAKASVNRIAKATGISIGSLYTYFENKDDLFCHVYAIYSKPHNLVPPITSLQNYAKERIALACDTKTYTDEQMALKEILMHNKDLLFRLLSGPTNYGVSHQIRACIEYDKKNGALRDNLDPELIKFLYMMVDYLAQKYRFEMQSETSMNAKAISESEDGTLEHAIADILFHGIYKTDTASPD